MSRKYNMTLFNRVTGEEDYFQLFGNSEWFPTLEKYLDSKGVDYQNDDYPYISDDAPLEITDLKEFVQVIDETVFYDIIHKNDKKTTDPLSLFEKYSEYFNFTDNFVCLDNDGLTVIPYTSIYNAALTSFNNSYVFQSYKFVQWLLENNAIVNEQATWTKHKYNLEAGQDENITILGQLDPNYKLTLAYW